jgi:hypothetical protein
VLFLIAKAAEWLGRLGGDSEVSRLLRAADEADRRRAAAKTDAMPRKGAREDQP